MLSKGVSAATSKMGQTMGKQAINGGASKMPAAGVPPTQATQGGGWPPKSMPSAGSGEAPKDGATPNQGGGTGSD